MKKMMMLMMTLLLVMSLLTGCSNSQNNSGDDLLAQIQAKGEITIACEGAWAPWNYHDENDVLTGYDVEVGRAIAKELGVEPVFIEGEWDALLAGLETGRYDLMINGVDVTEEREQKYYFSDPYVYAYTALIVRADNEEITSFEDLKGKTTANSINSTYMFLAEEYGATVSGVDTLDETLEMVLSGRVDATLNAEMSFYDYMSVHPDAQLKVVALTDDANKVAIPIRKDPSCESLVAAVNDALAKLAADGTLSELSTQFFGKDFSK